MKNILLIITLLIASVFYMQAQNTQDNILIYNGKEIIIHDNYTWEFAVPTEYSSDVREIEIDNKIKVEMFSTNQKYSLYVDSEKWQKTTGINDKAEFQFQNSDDTAYAMIIFDGLEIPLDSMKEVIIINANNIDPNARIINTEKCKIGNIHGELVTYTAKTAGLNFIFFTFLTSKEKGTIQFTCFTLESEFENQKMSFIDLISGFNF